MNSIITITGSASEPQLRYTKDGKAVANFGVLVKHGKDDNQRSSSFSVTIWGEQAENVVNNIVKGQRVIVTGRMEEETFTDREGNERKKMVIIADEVGKSLRWVD